MNPLMFGRDVDEMIGGHPAFDPTKFGERSSIMASFESQFFETTGAMQVVLSPAFSNENWPELQAFYNAQSQNAAIHAWDLDMRRLAFINSMLLGMLVGFN